MEYIEAVDRLQYNCRRIREETKHLNQSLRVIRDKFKVVEDINEECVPLIAQGEAMTLTRLYPWINQVRWELNGYYDDYGWTSEYFFMDKAQELADLAESIVVDLNSIESIARGDWKKLVHDCYDLFSNLDKTEELYERVVLKNQGDNDDRG